MDKGPASDQPGYLSVSIPWFNVFAPDVDVVYDGNNHFIDLTVHASDNDYDGFRVFSGETSEYLDLQDAVLNDAHLVTLLPDTYVNVGNYQLFYKVTSDKHE